MKLVTSLILFLISFHSFAQKIKIIDKESGKPIYNVTVFNEEQSYTASSDNEGFVDVSSVNQQALLFFSHISYTLRSVKKNMLKNTDFTVYLTKQFEQLDEVILSAFKGEAKANRVAEEVAVVSSKEIQKLSPQTSADLLAFIPGIRAQKSQMGGGSPVIRGMESNRILLVVDGVRMNNAIYRKGHLQNSITIAPNQLDKIEVIFGPSSVLYGSDALGGVIHYYTRTPKLSEKTSIKTGLFNRFSSSNNEVTTHTSIEISSKKWGSFTSFSFSDFGDLKMGKNRSHGFENWGKVFEYSENTDVYFSATPTENPDPTIQRNTHYHQSDFLQKFFVPLSAKIDLKLNLQYSTSSDIPRFDRLNEKINGELRFSEWYYGPQRRTLISPQLNFNLKENWADKAIFTFAYQNIKESRIQRKFGSLNRSYRKEKLDIFSINGDFTLSFMQDDTKNLAYGFELSYNDVTSNSFGKELVVSGNEIVGLSGDFLVYSRYPDGGSSYTSSAAYIDYRQDLNPKSTLNTGIRFTQTHLSALWTDKLSILLENFDVTLKNSAITATIGHVYKPSSRWQLNTVASSGFRSPNIDDIGRIREKSGNLTVPNVNVKPEFAYSGEIGIQKHFDKKKHTLGLNMYYTLLKDYIFRSTLEWYINSKDKIIPLVYDSEYKNFVGSQNGETAYIFGYTGSYSGKISDNISTSGFITYTKGRTYDSKLPMSSIPPLFGQFDLDYSKKQFQLGASIRFNSKKDISDFNLEEGIDNHDLTPIIDSNATEDSKIYFGSPSWITLRVTSGIEFNKHWKLQGMIDNVFDQHYREFASGISAPGRNFSFSLITNF